MKRILVVISITATTLAGASVFCTEYDATPSNASRVIGQAKGGDTVYLADGQYGNLWISASGSPGNFLTIKAAEGAMPIVKGNAGSTCVDLSGNWVRIEGLVAQGCATGFANKWGGGNGDLEFKYNIADDQGRNGISFYSDQNVLIEGNIVAHVGHTEGWSSGVNLYGATGSVIIRRHGTFRLKTSTPPAIGPTAAATLPMKARAARFSRTTSAFETAGRAFVSPRAPAPN